ncbi:MAG: amino acid adenylation domain-containing protein, partial [bacterium]
LPLTPNGKVDRKALPEPDDERPELGSRFVPPATVDEQLLAAVWSSVLEVSRVGVDDNFFSLGGDSILSVQVVALARERGLNLEVQDVFRYQTVRELVRVLRREEPEAPPRRSRPFELVAEEDRRRLPEGLEDAYPLAMLQAGMLFHLELAPDEGLYHNVVSFQLEAPFDAAAFDQAMNHIVRQHPAMRTSFDLHSYSEPLQFVHREARLPATYIDLRCLPSAQQSACITDLMEQERKHLFDLSKPPLMRFHVQRLDEEQFQLTITESHAVSDGWSLHSTLDELSRVYFARMRGEELPVEPQPETSLRDFIRLEREVLESSEAQRFWDRVLEDFTFAPLPQRESRSGTVPQPEAGKIVESVNVEISPSLSQGLHELARSWTLPVKTILLAAHFELLGRLFGQRDVVTGFITHGRPEAIDSHRVRGLFLNTLPLRLRLPGGSWRDLAEAAFAAETELLPYRRYPLAALQRRAGPQPLFEVAFNFIHFHVVEGLLRSGRMAVRGFDKYEPTNFPLLVGFGMGAGTDRLDLELAYDVRRLGRAQVSRIGRLYTEVLHSMASGTRQDRQNDSQLPAAEEHRLLREWSETGEGRVSADTIHGLFERQARAVPDRTALVWDENRISYAALEHRAERIAGALRRYGAGPGSVVGIALDRTPELVAGLLGILKSGAAYVPIDPAYPAARADQTLKDSGAVLVLSERRLADRFAEGSARLLLVDGDLEDGSEPSRSGRQAGPRDLAYLIYTSGSTGRPKGVAIEHHSTVNRLHWAARTFSPKERNGVLAATSVCFDLSVFELFTPLAWGGKVILATNVLHLSTLPAASEVTLVNTVPSAMQELVRSAGLPPGVRTVNLAGEALAPDLVADLYALPGVRRVANLYGPSEDTTYSTGAFLAAQAEGAPPIGRPVDGTHATVLDGNLLPVPGGTVGELYLGGSGLARGYRRRPALTAERFLPSPFSRAPGARMYRTGDLARHRWDGTLDFLGRRDQQVKVRGFRIELGEVESALRRHSQVQEAAVVAPASNGLRELRAFLVTEDSAELSSGALRTFLGGLLPDAMVPSAFVVLDALPLTPNGKVDRRALLRADGRRLASERSFEAPRDDIEETVATVWSDVLGVEEVGIHDNFFELGGSSLLLLRVHRKLQAAVGRELPMTHLFRFPNVASLAAYLREAKPLGEAAQEGAERAATRRDTLNARRRLRQRRRSEMA